MLIDNESKIFIQILYLNKHGLLTNKLRHNKNDVLNFSHLSNSDLYLWVRSL